MIFCQNIVNEICFDFCKKNKQKVQVQAYPQNFNSRVQFFFFLLISCSPGTWQPVFVRGVGEVFSSSLYYLLGITENLALSTLDLNVELR